MLHYNLSSFITLLYIRGNVNLWLRVIDEIHEYWFHAWTISYFHGISYGTQFCTYHIFSLKKSLKFNIWGKNQAPVKLCLFVYLLIYVRSRIFRSHWDGTSGFSVSRDHPKLVIIFYERHNIVSMHVIIMYSGINFCPYI